MRLQFLLLSFLAAFLLCGCGQSREAQLEGKWQMSNFTAPDGKTTAEMAKRIDAMKSSINLEIKKDNKFTLQLGQAIEGTWSFANDSLTLVPLKAGGVDIEEQKKQAIVKFKNNPAMLKKIQETSPNMMGKLSTDGKTLSMQSASGKGGSIVFSKAPSVP
jgi:hypothetical protein